jgi:soluble epoxide hydrolase/lipid-phosphate phosphatase
MIWKHQIQHFGSLGYWCVSPDMAGYGKSLAPKGNWADYALEEISKDNLALLSHLGRDQAVWIGHDWGAGAVSAYVSHHPETCQAMCLMSIPYLAATKGFDAIVQTVDRQRYPEAEYPYGQWAYMAHYMKHGEEEVQLFNRNRNGLKFLSLGFMPAGPENLERPALSSNESGWLGGKDLPDIPTDKSTGVLDQDVYDSLVEGYEKNGWYGPIAWYMNHEKNREYAEKNVPNGGELRQPVLYFDGKWDAVCGHSVSNELFEEPMRRLCKDLTYIEVETGHFVAQEKPKEVNNGIEAWLKEKKIVPQ